MTISRPIVLVLLCLLSHAAACAAGDSAGASMGGAGVGGVAGVGGAGGIGGAMNSARLLIESDTSVTLMPGEEVAMTVRYVDDRDAPLAHATINFTLIGRALDSGLSQLMSTTDDEGRASTRLVAGAQVASFQVRVSAANAQPVVIDAAVSDRGFGNLSAGVPYAGKRGVTQRRVALFAGQTCAEVAGGAMPDRQSNLTSLSDDARFIGLPAATRYAVLAIGFGAPAVALAQGCEDNVEVIADQEVAVDVTLVDLDLAPWGAYSMSVHLQTDALDAYVTERVRDHAMADPPGVTTSPAQRLLTALDEALRDDPTAIAQLAAADLLQQLRDPGSADAELQAALDAAGVGPTATLGWLGDRIDGGLSQVDLTFDVRLDMDDNTSEPRAAWTLRSAAAAGRAELGTLEHLIAEPTASLTTPTFAWELDQMSVNASAPTVFGALSVELVDAIMDGGDGQGRVDAKQWLGCSVLAGWVATHSALAEACDEACVNAACDRLLSSLVASLQTSLVALDTARPVVTLDATFDLLDESADAVVDGFETDACDVTWAADPTDVAGLADVFSGTAQAEVVVVAATP